MNNLWYNYITSFKEAGGYMKSYLYKMMVIIFILSSSIIIYKENNQERILYQNYIKNNIYESNIPKSRYEEPIVYDGYTMTELSGKLNNVLNSTLSGYGENIAKIALEYEVDPFVATGIILVETGCKWNCSYLTKHCNNIGGMKGSGCGSYASFSDLDTGINSFIRNLAKNYYAYGLTTPELMNRKYAENPNWHKDVNYYVNLIKAS